jgi:hypothetical protein
MGARRPVRADRPERPLSGQSTDLCRNVHQWARSAESGVGRVVFGTDYPFPWNKVPVDHILSTPGLSDDDKIAILGGTVAKLLGIS